MPQNDNAAAPMKKFLKRDTVVIEGRAGVGAASIAGAGADGPSLAVIFEDDVKQIVEVRCACGERIRIVCQYGAFDRGAPYAS